MTAQLRSWAQALGGVVGAKPPESPPDNRALALRRFAAAPEHFARKKDHARAEASVLALYGAHIGGSQP
jgi:hypothetical protein